MKLQIPAGATNRTILIFIQDSSSTLGEGLPGLAAADLNCRYIRVETDNDVTIAQLSLSDLANLTAIHSDGGIFPVDDTNAPGWYRLDLSDAILATGAWSVGISIIDAASNNVAQWTAEIELMDTTVATHGVNLVSAEADMLTGIADSFLDRDMSAGTDSGTTTFRTPRQALRILRNAWTISGATQTIYKEDDTTSSWSQVLGTTPGADPVTSVDPAS